MAALLLGAIGLSAQKIVESHTKKKDRKALEIYDAELREQERRRREERRRWKSMQAHAAMGVVGELPPSYEDVVRADRERGERGPGVGEGAGAGAGAGAGVHARERERERVEMGSRC